MGVISHASSAQPSPNHWRPLFSIFYSLIDLGILLLLYLNARELLTMTKKEEGPKADKILSNKWGGEGALMGAGRGVGEGGGEVLCAWSIPWVLSIP